MKRVLVSIILTILVLAFFLPLLHAEQGEKRVVKIATLPWKVRAPEEFDYIREALYDMVSSRIAVERHIAVVMESSIKRVFLMYKDEELTDDLIKEIGRELNADYVLVGSLTFIADTLSIDAKVIKVKGEEAPIYSVSQGRGLDSLISLLGRMALDLNAKILEGEGLPVTVISLGSVPRYVGTFGTQPQQSVEEEREDFIIVSREKRAEKNLWKSQTFTTQLKGMDVGDTDGDGRNEIVLIDRNNLWIYRKTGDTLKLIKEFKGKFFEENLTVDVEDLNGNGLDEIYVTRWTNNRLDSFVLEYKDGDYIEISSGLRWFLRVLDLPEGEKALLGQRTSGGQFFFRDVKRLYWKVNQLSDGGSLDIPPELNIYGFIRVDVDGDGEAETLGYNSSDRLVLYSKIKGKGWKEVWKSKDFFGGTLNTITRESGVVETSSSENLAQVAIKGRILQKDLDMDGEAEVIINRNITSKIGRYLERSRSYKKGEIIDMVWNGKDLEENWRTKVIEGYIADFQIDDLDSDGFKDLIVVLVTQFEGMKKESTSHLISYRLNVR